MERITLSTKLGSIVGNVRDNCYEFLGVRYATAKRFEYASLVTKFDGEYDATKNGDACVQKRQFYPHLENPERLFYHNEFRKGIEFTYSEDCLNLNIWTPKEKGVYPVIIYIHGGGFDSGSIYESNVDGEAYAKRGVIYVAIEYRVGVFGYLTNETLAKENGYDGNFGLDDQYKSILWVKENIADFGGDPDNITLMGQSAGAISIQYLCLTPKSKGLFKRVIMMSGAGKFPDFSLPRPCEDTRAYWDEVIKLAGCKDIQELKTVDHETLFKAIEHQRETRKDNTYHNMPVIDHNYITESVKEMIKHPLDDVGYMIGFTNNDMYALIMASIGLKFARDNNGYVYYFDINAKGDKNKAFHSSDLHYATETLSRSWRPYDESDYRTAKVMVDYFANYAKTGNPNGENLANWEIKKNHAMVFKSSGNKMGRPCKMKLLHNTLFGGIK